MKSFTLSLLTAAIASTTMPTAFASQQSEDKGFLDDSHLSLVLRNYYFNHDNRGVDDKKDWAQAAMLTYQSGFTQGLVGFGLDAFGYGVLKLDGQNGGTGNLKTSNNGATDSFTHIGGAVKVRISNTTLKYGELQPTAPVFAAGGARILPQTAQGFQLLSNEIKGLALQAGHFTSSTGWDGSSNHEPIFATYALVETRSADYIGGDYTIAPNLSASLYASKFEDLWRQYYGNLTYTLPLTEAQALNFNANFYHTTDEGRALAGEINNTAGSLALGYIFGAHTISLTYQQIQGDEPFDYVGFGKSDTVGDSVLLGNSVHFSDFNGPGEKSLQLRYELDMAGYGVPGLSFMGRYVYGKDVDGTHADANGAYVGLYGTDDRERETDIDVKYVIQSGPVKDLALRIRQAWHRGASSLGGDVDQFRLMVEYPLQIL